MPPDSAEIWCLIHAELSRSVTDATFELWLSELRAVGFEGDVLLVEAPGPVRGWVADRFAGVLDASAAAVLVPQARVEIAGGGGRAPHEPEPVAGWVGWSVRD